jgi:hypothetical protein
VRELAVNDLTITDVGTILTSIAKQATGASTLSVNNTKDFITVAQTTLKVGYDPLIASISQVLSKTIFSIRPYYRKFAGINVSNQQFGNITRKLNISDKDWETDERLPLTDAASVDMYKVIKPSILQTNFYGANKYQRHITIFKDQLDTAFASPDEFGRFITMVMQNATDVIEQGHETLARSVIANFIGGILADEDNGTRTIHLLTEYNELTGQTLTAETVYQADNFGNFMKFVVARIKSLSAMFTERTQLYQTQVTDKPITRHTPYRNQKLYLFSPTQYLTETAVLTDLYNDQYMKLMDFERVNFWQNPNSPDALNVMPIYLKSDGTLTSPTAAVNEAHVFGVLFDDEALGYTVVNQWSATTPFNAAGGYSNVYYHFTDRYWNDFTEKGVVLLLD